MTTHVLATLRFVWVEEQLHVKPFRSLVNSNEPLDYETFFTRAAKNVAFPYDAIQWDRLQVIVDNGIGQARTVYDRSHPGPVIIPQHPGVIITLFNRTMLIPIHLRLGGEWKPTSSEMWLIPADVDMSITAMKEYLLTGNFLPNTTSILTRMRDDARDHLDDRTFPLALEQNNMLSMFSLSAKYTDEADAVYPEGRSLIINLFSYENPTHIAPKLVFGMIPLSWWE
jgi:hypothetical protein